MAIRACHADFTLQLPKFPGFLNLLTGHLRSDNLWVYSAPLTLGGFQSSELYVFTNRPLFPAPCASLTVFRLFTAFFLGLRGFPYLLAVPTYVHQRPRFALAPCPRFFLELVSVLRFSPVSELCS